MRDQVSVIQFPPNAVGQVGTWSSSEETFSRTTFSSLLMGVYKEQDLFLPPVGGLALLSQDILHLSDPTLCQSISSAVVSTGVDVSDPMSLQPR